MVVTRGREKEKDTDFGDPGILEPGLFGYLFPLLKRVTWLVRSPGLGEGRPTSTSGLFGWFIIFTTMLTKKFASVALRVGFSGEPAVPELAADAFAGVALSDIFVKFS